MTGSNESPSHELSKIRYEQFICYLTLTLSAVTVHFRKKPKFTETFTIIISIRVRDISLTLSTYFWRASDARVPS